MSVEVRLTSVLERHVGAKSVQSDGSTVAELLANLEASYPGFMGLITGDDGKLHRFVNIYLNDEDVRYLGALDTPLKDGDVLSILPALAGGAVNWASKACAYHKGDGVVALPRLSNGARYPVCGGQGAALVAQPAGRCGFFAKAEAGSGMTASNAFAAVFVAEPAGHWRVRLPMKM
jgi:molybdopterin synthase sulfur carrier subunit